MDTKWETDVIHGSGYFAAKNAASRQGAYRASHSDYRDREATRQQSRNYSDYNERRRSLTLSRPFIGWDTEGSNTNATPFLFGSSRGDYLAHPELSTREIFETILHREKQEPNALHVVYGAEYDFNMFLRDVQLPALNALKRYGHCLWGEYKLEHVPRKWFTVSRPGYAVAKLFDVVSFFACPYIDALDAHGIGTDEQRALIREGKQQRANFTFADIDYIEKYWRTELVLLPQLMDKLRAAFHKAGMYITSWHGPGALARRMLTDHGIKKVQAKVPEPVHDAARYAFAGGRFESFSAGLYEGTVYNADRNSAYPYAATFLPDLATGRWEYVANVDRDKIDPSQFALYHVEYMVSNGERSFTIGPQPIFRRYGDDRVAWPTSVRNWIWSPEAFTVRDNTHTNFLEAYIYRDDGSRPFSFLKEYYEHRLLLKRLGDPTQIAFKLGPNSVYGQLAQRAGWQKGIPPFHQIEMAGYVTSHCRAAVYEVARKAWDRGELISIDTDGVFTTGPIPETDLPEPYGSGLGEWEPSRSDGILYWQSGVYWNRKNGEWKLAKSRGAPKGLIPASGAFEALANGFSDLKYTRSELIGYRWALRNGMTKWRYFVEQERKISFGGAPGSKRYHNPRQCQTCKGSSNSTMHDLSLGFNGYAGSIDSRKHNLPWESNDHDSPGDIIDAKSDMIIDEIWLEEP